MKCPLRTYSYKGEYDQQEREDLDCLKEKCAWWIQGDEGCAVRVLSSDLTLLSLSIAAIADKIPHEEQFRR